jgi:hypothetical protein
LFAFFDCDRNPGQFNFAFFFVTGYDGTLTIIAFSSPFVYSALFVSIFVMLANRFPALSMA